MYRCSEGEKLTSLQKHGHISTSNPPSEQLTRRGGGGEQEAGAGKTPVWSVSKPDRRLPAAAHAQMEQIKGRLAAHTCGNLITADWVCGEQVASRSGTRSLLLHVYRPVNRPAHIPGQMHTVTVSPVACHSSCIPAEIYGVITY